MRYAKEFIRSYPEAQHFDWRVMTQGAAYLGLTIALLMAAYFTTVRLFTDSIPPIVHYVQYIILFGFVNLFLVKQKQNTGYDEPFVAKGFTAGAMLSVFSGLFFCVIELCIYAMIPGAAVFGDEIMVTAAGSSPVLATATMFMEIFVFGMLSTFIAFQYLKRPHERSRTEI